jgi:glycerophosphoryl diester phosphodiesterase
MIRALYDGPFWSKSLNAMAKRAIKSGRGQPHSKTIRNFLGLKFSRSVLECGCPLPLSTHRSLPSPRVWMQMLAASLTLSCCFGAEPTPLIHTHAHNDYEHKRPLFDALDHGFCSVEADIYIVDGQLLVAHNRSQVKPERTLQSLYLDPLRERVKKNGGRVYADGPEVTLLIDIKPDWRTIYPTLREVLKQYADILSTFEGDQKKTNAITAILSGSRSLDMFKGETVRYAAYDGTLANLDSDASANLIPWVSENWGAGFKWPGHGEMSAADKLKLKEIVGKAHQKGRQVRFWGAPDNPTFWREMLANGVDLINTDDLDGVQKFFESRSSTTDGHR